MPPNSEYTDQHNIPVARIRHKQKSAAVVGVPRPTLEGWEAGDGNDDESVNVSAPD